MASVAATGLSTGVARADDARQVAPDGKSAVVKNGRINHSVCLWCYNGMKSSDMAPVAKRLGMKAVDLLTPREFGPLKENGVICSMTSGVWGGITKGLNRTEHHDEIVKSLTDLCDATAAAGYP